MHLKNFDFKNVLGPRYKNDDKINMFKKIIFKIKFHKTSKN